MNYHPFGGLRQLKWSLFTGDERNQRTQKGLLIFIAVLVLFSFGHLLYQKLQPTVLVYQRAYADEAEMKSMPPDSLNAKIQSLKDELLDELAECESPGDTENTLPIIEDNNSRGTLARREVPSIGEYRFKIGTVMLYWKQWKGETLTAVQASLIALDHTKSRELASYVIFETENGLDNWYNCTVRLGLEEKLKTIRFLEE